MPTNISVGMPRKRRNERRNDPGSKSAYEKSWQRFGWCLGGLFVALVVFGVYFIGH